MAEKTSEPASSSDPHTRPKAGDQARVNYDAAMSEWRLDGPIDLLQTLAPLQRGHANPTMQVEASRVVRTSRTPEGPATLLIEIERPDRARARAWGPGAHWMLERAPAMLGTCDLDERGELSDPIVARLSRLARGMRQPHVPGVVELLIPTVLDQLVTGAEATRAYHRLLRHFGEPAPGPFVRLLLPPRPEQLARLTSTVGTPLGILAKQGATLRRIGERADRLEEAAAMPMDEAEKRLRAIAGIGVWTANMVLLDGLGHPDAMPVGDYGLPSVVAFNLAGERKADDARMLELLAPYAGQRGRVLRWIRGAGQLPERHGPRGKVRDLPSAFPR